MEGPSHLSSLSPLHSALCLGSDLICLWSFHLFDSLDLRQFWCTYYTLYTVNTIVYCSFSVGSRRSRINSKNELASSTTVCCLMEEYANVLVHFRYELNQFSSVDSRIQTRVGSQYSSCFLWTSDGIDFFLCHHNCLTLRSLPLWLLLSWPHFKLVEGGVEREMNSCCSVSVLYESHLHSISKLVNIPLLFPSWYVFTHDEFIALTAKELISEERVRLILRFINRLSQGINVRHKSSLLVSFQSFYSPTHFQPSLLDCQRRSRVHSFVWLSNFTKLIPKAESIIVCLFLFLVHQKGEVFISL